MKDYPARAWEWLGLELDRWADAGLQAQFWWRDDDAVGSTGALDRLLEQSDSHAVPLTLAVIPAKLRANLSLRLAKHPRVVVFQHGFAHRSHAAPGQRKLELGGDREQAAIIADLRGGYDILQRAFGEGFVPVLVPPWNRFDPGLLTELGAIGLRGISTMKARRSAQPVPGLLQINAHLDPVHWRHRRGFIGTYPAIAILVQHLSAKRSGYRDHTEPTGLLTHHLEQDERVWRFSEQLLRFINAHPAAEWRDARELWRSPDA